MDWFTPYRRAFPAIEVKPLEWYSLEYLAFHMREIDRLEIFGNLPSDNPLEVVAMIMHQTAKTEGLGYLAFYHQRPIAAWGIFENFPGNWQIWAFGTDEWSLAPLAMRESWDTALAHLRARNALRVECKSRYNHADAHRFLRYLGFEQEAVLKRYGKDGADYFLYARLF